MPGPKFEETPPEKSWWQRYSLKMAAGATIVLLLAGAYFFYQNYRERKEMLQIAIGNLNELASTTPQNAAQSNSSVNNSLTSPANPATNAPAKIAATIQSPEITKQSNAIVAKAVRSNGKTHLARAALKSYLEDHEETRNQLRTEQKIYIEDYLQKHSPGSSGLRVGDEISFSNDQISEAIAAAQRLTDNQIENLFKYVPLVPFL